MKTKKKRCIQKKTKKGSSTLPLVQKKEEVGPLIEPNLAFEFLKFGQKPLTRKEALQIQEIVQKVFGPSVSLDYVPTLDSTIKELSSIDTVVDAYPVFEVFRDEVTLENEFLVLNQTFSTSASESTLKDMQKTLEKEAKKQLLELFPTHYAENESNALVKVTFVPNLVQSQPLFAPREKEEQTEGDEHKRVMSIPPRSSWVTITLSFLGRSLMKPEEQQQLVYWWECGFELFVLETCEKLQLQFDAQSFTRKIGVERKKDEVFTPLPSGKEQHFSSAQLLGMGVNIKKDLLPPPWLSSLNLSMDNRFPTVGTITTTTVPIATTTTTSTTTTTTTTTTTATVTTTTTPSTATTTTTTPSTTATATTTTSPPVTEDGPPLAPAMDDGPPLAPDDGPPIAPAMDDNGPPIAPAMDGDGGGAPAAPMDGAPAAPSGNTNASQVKPIPKKPTPAVVKKAVVPKDINVDLTEFKEIEGLEDEEKRKERACKVVKSVSEQEKKGSIWTDSTAQLRYKRIVLFCDPTAGKGLKKTTSQFAKEIAPAAADAPQTPLQALQQKNEKKEDKTKGRKLTQKEVEELERLKTKPHCEQKWENLKKSYSLQQLREVQEPSKLKLMDRAYAADKSAVNGWRFQKITWTKSPLEQEIIKGLNSTISSNFYTELDDYAKFIHKTDYEAGKGIVFWLFGPPRVVSDGVNPKYWFDDKDFDLPLRTCEGRNPWTKEETVKGVRAGVFKTKLNANVSEVFLKYGHKWIPIEITSYGTCMLDREQECFDSQTQKARCIPLDCVPSSTISEEQREELTEPTTDAQPTSLDDLFSINEDE